MKASMPVALAGFAALLLAVGPRSDGQQSPAAAGTCAAVAAPEPAPAPATGGIVDAPRAAAGERRDEPTTMLLLPDGTRVLALNGATSAPPLAEAWPTGKPFSPIVRVERSDLGVDWFVHADGTRSTTEMKWRDDLGRFDAVTRTAVPTAARPAPVAQR